MGKYIVIQFHTESLRNNKNEYLTITKTITNLTTMMVKESKRTRVNMVVFYLYQAWNLEKIICDVRSWGNGCP